MPSCSLVVQVRGGGERKGEGGGGEDQGSRGDTQADRGGCGQGESSRRAVQEILKQDKGAPVPMVEQIIVLYALTKGHFFGMLPVKVDEWQKKLIIHIRKHRPQLIVDLTAGKVLTREIKEGLDEQLRLFKDSSI